MKKPAKITLWIVIILAVLFLSLNLVIKTALSIGVRMTTGVGLRVGSVLVQPIKGAVTVNHMKILNPRGFEEREMISLPRLYVDYEVAPLFQGKFHFKEIDLEMDQMTIVRNKQGQTNVASLNAAKQSTGPAKTKSTQVSSIPFFITSLHLKVGKVTFKDYTTTPVTTREFIVGINKEFRNVSDPNQLIALVVMTTMMQTPLANLSGLNFGNLDGQFSSALKDANAIANSLGINNQNFEQLGNDSQQATKQAVEGILKKAFGQ